MCALISCSARNMYPSLAGLPVGTLVDNYADKTDAFLREEIRRVSIDAFKTMASAVAKDIVELRLLLGSAKETGTTFPEKISTVAVLEHQKIRHVVKEDIFVDSAIELRLVPLDVRTSTKAHIEATLRFRSWLRDTPASIEHSQTLHFKLDNLKSDLYFILYPSSTTSQSGILQSVDEQRKAFINLYQQGQTNREPNTANYDLDINDYFKTFCKRGVRASDLLAVGRSEVGKRLDPQHEKDDLGFLDAFLDVTQTNVSVESRTVGDQQFVLFWAQHRLRGKSFPIAHLASLNTNLEKINDYIDRHEPHETHEQQINARLQHTVFVNLALSDTVFYNVLCDAYQDCLMQHLLLVRFRFLTPPAGQEAHDQGERKRRRP